MGDGMDAFEEMDAQLGLVSIREDMEKLKKVGVIMNSFFQQGNYAQGLQHSEACLTLTNKLKEVLADPKHPTDADPQIEEILRWIQPLIARVQQLQQIQQQQQQQQLSSGEIIITPRSPLASPRNCLSPNPMQQPQQQQQQQQQRFLLPAGAAGRAASPLSARGVSPRTLSPLPVSSRLTCSGGQSPYHSPRGSPYRPSSPGGGLASSAPHRAESFGRVCFPNKETLAMSGGVAFEDEEEKEEGMIDTTLELTVYQARFPHVSHLPDWLAMEPGDMVTRIFSPDMDPIPGWEIGVSHVTGEIGLFPVAYADVVETGFQHSAMVRQKAPEGSEEKKEGEEGDKQREGENLERPQAITEITEESLKKMRKLNKRSSLYGVNMINQKATHPEAKEKKKMGIAGDRRASLALIKVAKKESGVSWDKPGVKTITINPPKKGSREKKRVKEEIEGIIASLSSNSDQVVKVDLSGAGTISYSILKKLYLSLKSNKHLIYLSLRGVGVNGSHIQLLTVSLAVNRTLRCLDLRGNGFGVKEAKLVETLIQKNYGLMEMKLFDPAEAEKKDIAATMQNIDWYCKSNIEFSRFVKGEHTELRLCGRAIVSTLGWENYPKTTLLNASFNYLKEINPKIGSVMVNLTEVNFSNNDISTIPYSFGQLTHLNSLDCSNNQIKEVPSSLDRCEALTDLNVSNNKIRTFPRTVLTLPNLMSVHAENNKCKIPPQMDPSETIKFLLEKYAK